MIGTEVEQPPTKSIFARSPFSFPLKSSRRFRKLNYRDMRSKLIGKTSSLYMWDPMSVIKKYLFLFSLLLFLSISSPISATRPAARLPTRHRGGTASATHPHSMAERLLAYTMWRRLRLCGGMVATAIGQLCAF